MTLVLRLFGPLTLWLAGFSAVYALQGLVCSTRWIGFGLTEADGRLALTAAWGALIALQLAIGLLLHRNRPASPAGVLADISLWLSGVAILATVWALFPVMLVSACT